MDRIFSAEHIIPVIGDPVKNGVVAIDENDKIIGVYKDSDPYLSGKKIEKLNGIITPGFVNTHCHIELSHMAGTVPRETGLVSFLKTVLTTRNASEETIKEAIAAADKQMQENGIVAVGDHANTAISKEIKKESNIHYHTFVEVMGFDPEHAADRLREVIEVCQSFENSNSTLTPHAPYSVSKALFRLLGVALENETDVLSMHNQETDEENKLFRYKKGEFIDFYNTIGVDISGFKPQARNSLQTVAAYLPKNNPVLLVHNTYTSSKDISYLNRMGRRVTWCLCPNANMFIEGRLPKVTNFINSGYPITLGTDSLASNTNLCVLSELKTLHQSNKELDFTETIKWITINGANALGISDRFGTLEVGKTPGLNLLRNTKGTQITAETTVEKLV